jgi:adenosine deaminase
VNQWKDETALYVTRQWLFELPKVELHCHLDGSLRPETIWELAQDQGVPLPVHSRAEIRQYFTAKKRSLSDYLRLFEYTLRVLQEEASIRRAVVELLEDFAAENGRYIEIRFAPLLHLRLGLTPDQVVKAALAGLEEGQSRTGVRGGLILCCMRQEDPQRSVEVAQLAIRYRQAGVVALDLAGPERGFPPNRHRRAFELTKEAGLALTIHAGEEPCTEYIAQALEMGADRIGHGFYLNQADEALQRTIIERQIALEMCPTSNLQTVPLNDYTEHPIKGYYEVGVRVTLNTDNRLMSNTTLTDELWHIASAFDFSRAEIEELLLNSSRAAFRPETA